jgi:hypothetical protein
MTANAKTAAHAAATIVTKSAAADYTAKTGIIVYGSFRRFDSLYSAVYLDTLRAFSEFESKCAAQDAKIAATVAAKEVYESDIKAAYLAFDAGAIDAAGLLLATKAADRKFNAAVAE